MSDLSQPVATLVAAVIAAFLGSLAGGWTALHRFRRERTFDRQLEWHERGLRSISGLSEALSIAMLFEKEGRGNDDFWIQVQARHLEVLRFANEAPIYGTSKSVETAYAARECVQKGAEISNIYEPRTMDDAGREKALSDLQGYPAAFGRAALDVAAHARRHLGLERLP